MALPHLKLVKLDHTNNKLQTHPLLKVEQVLPLKLNPSHSSNLLLMNPSPHLALLQP